MTALDCALRVLSLGLLPLLLPPGQKEPRQRAWHKNRYSEATLRQQYAAGNEAVGLILGPNSAIDIECDSEESPAELLELFDGAIPETPSWSSRRGIHRLFKWDERLVGLGATTKYKTVEVRLGADDKAAYSLLPPSATDGCTREWLTPVGSVEIASLPDKVIDKIIAAAKENAKTPKPQPNTPSPPANYTIEAPNGDKPGDDFCRRADWRQILEPYGWEFVEKVKETSHWRRPDKTDDGISATTGYCTSDSGHDLLFVFSSEAPPFVQNKGYSKFAAYALLNHNGDFASAARALGAKGYGKQERVSASSKLVELAKDFHLFHSLDLEPFATVENNGHFETYAVGSKDFELYLDYEYFKNTGKSAPQRALTEATRTLAARARFQGPQVPVHLRVAQVNDKYYLDLANDKWDVVEITRDGWKVIPCPLNVKFRRSRGMQALPKPEAGGKIDELRQFVNVDDGSFILLVACVLAALRPKGPYPIALLTSNHGSGKTTTMRYCRSLVDPSTANVRAAPNDVPSLMVAAKHSAMMCIDNCDGLPQWLSSALCRLSTGGGMTSRALYTNDDEHLVNCMRPTWITCITDVAEREDLLSRCVPIKCPPIPANRRRDEQSIDAEFEKARPRILGAILDGFCCAIRTVGTINVGSCPRMADFFKWSAAAETGLGWKEGTFKKHFDESQQEISTMALDNPVVTGIQMLLTPSDAHCVHLEHTSESITWKGTATLLRNNLFDRCKCAGLPFDRDWPKSASALSGRLKRLQANLAEVGIEVFQRRKIWTITRKTETTKNIAPENRAAA